MRGLIAGDSGLVTVELNRRRFLTTPLGKRRAELRPEDLLCVDLGGESIQDALGLDPDLWMPHRLAYQTRVDDVYSTGSPNNGQLAPIRATILAEPAHVMALMRLKINEPQLQFGEDHPIPVLESMNESAVKNTLSQSRVVGIRNCGLLVAAPQLAEALNWIERTEHAAAIEIAIHRGR